MVLRRTWQRWHRNVRFWMDPSAYQLFHAEAYYHGEISYPPPPLRKLTFKGGSDEDLDEA